MAKQNKLAVIDLGSNTAILLIFTHQPEFKVLREEFRIPRLAEKLDPGGDFFPAALTRACDALKEFQSICKAEQAQLICCGGTAPFRKVRDPIAAIDEIYRRTQIRVRPLSEEEEARCSYVSATQLDCKEFPTPQFSNACVLDIGGGSCEIAHGHAKSMQDFHSIPMGCVDLTEKYLPEQLQNVGEIADKQISRLSAAIASQLPNNLIGEAATFFAVAGTPMTLALLEKQIHVYEPNRVDGLSIALPQVRFWLERMATTSLTDKINTYGIPQGRAEILLAGLIILVAVMERYRFSAVIARNAGVRYGLAQAPVML